MLVPSVKAMQAALLLISRDCEAEFDVMVGVCVHQVHLASHVGDGCAGRGWE